MENSRLAFTISFDEIIKSFLFITQIIPFRNVAYLYFFSYLFSAISSAVLFITIMVAVIAKKGELIKFWLFLKFGIKFKDNADVMRNIV